MQPETALPDPDTAAANTSPRRANVLMLDDDVALTALLKVFLESQGWSVVVEPNGVEALKRVMAADFDVILCDMVMPNVPGDKFYLAVERIKPHLCRRFIFMTGYRTEPSIEDFIQKVNGTILFKPFELSRLQDAVEQVLQRGTRTGNG